MALKSETFLKWYGGFRTCTCCSLSTGVWLIVLSDLLTSTGLLATAIYQLAIAVEQVPEQALTFGMSQITGIVVRLMGATLGVVGLARKSPGLILVAWLIYLMDLAIFLSGSVVGSGIAFTTYGILGLVGAIGIVTVVALTEGLFSAILFSYYIQLKAEKLERRESEILEEHEALIASEMENKEEAVEAAAKLLAK